MAETMQSKYIAVAYKLYVTHDGEREMIEEAPEEHPFQFMTGFGMTLDKFESTLMEKSEGDKFTLDLTVEEAYGARNDEYVIELDKNIFSIDGKFDEEHIVPGAMVPLQTADGQRLNGHCIEVKEDKVVMDMNHPLAGEALTFELSVKTHRDATEEEINETIKQLTGGCSCGDGSCGCGDGDSSCGCGDGCC